MLSAVYCFLAAVNILSVLMVLTDKAAAMSGLRRVRERTFFITAAVGGATAMLIAMLLVRHKTKHKRFMIGLPCIMLTQYILAFILYKYTPLP